MVFFLFFNFLLKTLSWGLAFGSCLRLLLYIIISGNYPALTGPALFLKYFVQYVTFSQIFRLSVHFHSMEWNFHNRWIRFEQAKTRFGVERDILSLLWAVRIKFYFRTYKFWPVFYTQNGFKYVSKPWLTHSTQLLNLTKSVKTVLSYPQIS